MYKTIMVPTDCSGFDREAIRVALRLAERSEAKIRLVRAFTNNGYFGMAAAGDAIAMTVESTCLERDKALSELYALAAECRTLTDADVGVSLEEGPVADTLAAYANREEVDLIVISSHGRGGISRLSLGSVTDSLIRHTTIPVLVVKPVPSYLNPQVSKPFNRIVVPLDGSSLAEQILPKVAILAEMEGAELTLLYVLRPSARLEDEIPNAGAPWWDKDVAAARAYLQRRAGDLRHYGLSVTTDVVIGERVSEEITAFASRVRADLIAIATHGRGGLSRLLNGSVADAVTRSARNSTLVFHPDRAVARADLGTANRSDQLTPAIA
jgi:nucleotide-binding universal stress UspA family protein